VTAEAGKSLPQLLEAPCLQVKESVANQATPDPIHLVSSSKVNAPRVE
jgi:hypothetical protein